jgi:hypothetical protein
MEVNVQHHVPAALPLGKNCIPIVQEAGGEVWRRENLLVLTGI